MIYNLNKPVDWTSFDVVKKIRTITKEKKVGHGGTLDPFATGVLIVGTGKDTKRLGEISSTDKKYKATMMLGSETDTLDTEGVIVKTLPIPENCNSTTINNVFKEFLGTYLQIPPMFSAKKINGMKLYELARKNITVHREPVPVNIHDITLIDFTTPQITFTVTCSKGTYIRVLAKDIAEKLDTCGYLVQLERTRVGNYDIEDALTMMDFEKQWSFIKT